MSSKKNRRVADITFSSHKYIDKNGQEKHFEISVGCLMQDENGKQFLLLNKWFNPAGVFAGESSSVFLSINPQNQHQQNAQSQQSRGSNRFNGYQTDKPSQRENEAQQAFYGAAQ